MIIVHVSDLHLGKAQRPRLPGVLSGVADASYQAMRDLADSASFDSAAKTVLLGSNQRIVCIVSGDYSATGDELDRGLQFVEDRIFLQSHDYCGLSYGDVTRGVLGNHDIWGGAHPFLAWARARKKQQAAEFLVNRPPAARWDDVVRLGPRYFDEGNLRLRFYFLDSNSPGIRNVLARGRVRLRDLETLEGYVDADRQFDARTTRRLAVLRILVLHHPISDRGHGLTMKLENAGEVLSFLRRYGFGLVLCGHEHEFSSQSLSSRIYECTAGSACQTVRGSASNTYVVLQVDGSQSVESAGPSRIRLRLRVLRRNYPDHISPSGFNADPDRTIDPHVDIF